MILSIEIIVAVLFVIEAKLEKYVIAMKSEQTPNYHSNNKREHAWSLVWSAFFCIYMCWLSDIWVLLPSIFISRRLFFDYPLKLFRGRSLTAIEGDGWFDNTSRRLLGRNGGIQELLLTLLLKGAYLFFIIKILGHGI